MKILLVQDWLRSGGTERQTVLLANGFSARGHAVALVTFRPGGRLAGTVSPQVVHRSLQPFDLGLDWFAPALIGTARRLRPDVVLCMGRMANCQGGALQAAMPDATVIGTMRTGKPLPWLFRRSLRRVRHVVANSQDALNALVTRHGLSEDRISVIRNSLVFPTLTEQQAGAGGQLRAQFGAGDSTTVLLCVAMFRPEKNQRELIEIVAGLPSSADVQLWLAGDGPTRHACASKVAALGLGGRVKLLGFQPDPGPLYAAADIAVHASSSESLSNFIIEAQAHGLPAVAYEAQGIRECFLVDETGWTLRRGDRDGFRDRIMSLVNAPDSDRQARAKRASAFARATFDAEHQVSRYLQLFNALRTAGPRTAAPRTAP